MADREPSDDNLTNPNATLEERVSDLERRYAASERRQAQTIEAISAEFRSLRNELLGDGREHAPPLSDGANE